MVLTYAVRLFRFDKINPSCTSLLYHWPITASKLYSISFFKSGILLQQPIALLEGISVHFFECVLHHPEGNESTWDIQPSWVDTAAAGPILLLDANSVVKQNGGILVLFSRFRRGTENRGFNQIHFFFAEVFQITSRFIFAEKKIGARCASNKPILLSSSPSPPRPI